MPLFQKVIFYVWYPVCLKHDSGLSCMKYFHLPANCFICIQRHFLQIYKNCGQFLKTVQNFKSFYYAHYFFFYNTLNHLLMKCYFFPPSLFLHKVSYIFHLKVLQYHTEWSNVSKKGFTSHFRILFSECNSRFNWSTQ